MADQTKKVSEFPIATTLVGTDRILILQTPDTNPTVKTATTDLLVSKIAVFADYVTTSQLSSNLNNYVNKSQLSSLVSVLTVNNSLYLGGVPAASYVNTAQLSSNLQNYVSSSQLAANLNNYITKLDSSSSLNQYAKITDLQIYVENLTANNTTYLGGVPASSYVNATSLNSTLSSYITTTQLTGNLNNYQTTAGLSGNVLNLTANNVTYVGSTLAANVVSDQSLAANLANYVLISNLSSYFGTASVNNSAYLGGIIATDYVTDAELTANLVNYTTFGDLADYISSQIIPGVAVANSALYIGNVAAANVVYYSNTSNYTISIGNTSVNTVVNSSSFKVSSIVANGSIGTNGQVLTSNGTTIYWANASGAIYSGDNPPAGAANNTLWFNTVDGSLYIYYTDVDTSQWVEVAHSEIIANLSVNVDAQYFWTNAHNFGSTLVANNINITSLTANNTLGTSGQILTSNGSAVYWGNLNAYQTTAGLAANVATLAANSANYLGTFEAARYQKYDVAGFIANTINASEVVFAFAPVSNVRFSGNFSGSRGYSRVASTGTYILEVKKNGSAVGTITFTSSNSATFATTAGANVDIVANDMITFVGNATPDATLADISITLKGVIV